MAATDSGVRFGGGSVLETRRDHSFAPGRGTASPPGSRGRRLRRATLLVLLLLGIIAVGLSACRTPTRRGLYLALKFTYYERTLEPAAGALSHEKLDLVYPELGVFDPARGGFTDFIQSFRVALGGEVPGDPAMTAALATLPARLEKAFGPATARVAWIYLNRRPKPGEGPGGEVSEQTASSPTFDPGETDHRQSLERTVRLLQQLGFEGVQLDLEPFPEGDVPAMVTLLEALRAATGPGFMLSIFTPKYVRPQSRVIHPGFVWSSLEPFERLAAHVDQLVVPLYDYGPLARDAQAYRARVEEAARDLLPRVRPVERVWFSLPAYRSTPQHSSSETVPGALEALGEVRRRPGGFAIFVYSGEATDYQPAGER